MYNEKYVIENIKNCIMRVKSAVYTKVCDLNLEIYSSKEPLSYENRTAGDYRRITVGEKWGDLFDCAWFHCTATVPAEAAGKKLVYVIDINGEGLIYDDSGCPLRGITNLNSAFDRAKGNPGKRIVPFCEEAVAGQPIDFWMDAGCNDLVGNLRENGTIKEAYVAVCNDLARDLYYDMNLLFIQADKTSKEDAIHYELLDVLSKCRRALVDYTDEEMLRCREITKARLALKGGDDPAISLVAFGHAHIDLAWLWPVRETKRKGARTFSTARQLMDRYEDYLFGSSSPQLYRWVKEEYPVLYNKVKDSYKAGRWELLGATWVESDFNLISGESVVRQLLYGNEFWKQEFGETVDFVWTPDTFGYSAALPQIFKKSGINYFSTIKLNWNLINDFPYINFRWRGIDGSEVLVHLPTEGNYLSEATPGSLINARRHLAKCGQFGEGLLPYGIGDGGGGPSPFHLEYLKREKNLPGLCPVEQGKMGEFFHRLEKRAADLPVLDEELYLERHLGVYTSAAKSKMYNRKCELALREAEIWCSIAHRQYGFAYPKHQLEEIWKEVLLYQFHDVLPGSSINRVYNESHERYVVLLQQIDAIREEALAAIVGGQAGEKLALFNSLSFPRRYVYKTENGYLETVLPAMGYGVIDPKEATRTASMTDLENDFLKVTFNADGTIGSIYNKKIGEELLNGASNRFLIYDDIENAWNLQYDYRNQVPTQLFATETVGAATVDGYTVTQKYTYRKSEFTVRISLGQNDDVLRFDVCADWHELGKMLRIAFDSSVYSDLVSCETQFGTVKRSTKNNTTEQQAQIEMAVHRWLALSRPGLNFAILNDSKYGYGVEDNQIELCALRGTDYPAKALDHGVHHFSYGIYADAAAGLIDVVKRGYEFNVTVPAVPVATETVPNSYLSTDCENVLIDGIKLSQDEKSLVVRTYEAEGRRSEANLCSKLDGEEIVLCDLKEDVLPEKAADVEYQPYSIISYKI
ncbi:MAG: glycosyl hydrolase-related protein [Clostridia bacterium]|nr:glycosyl hydrolase-related protein [Clostridia bacterium]